jgi:carboxypeptidase Taq
MEQNEFTEYRNYWKELTYLRDVVSILHWDSEVVMPEDARAGRAEQISNLTTLHHKKYINQDFSRVIDRAANWIERTNPENYSSLKRELSVLQKDRERAVKLPVELVEKFSKTTNLAFGVWMNAKANKNFSEFEPILSEIVALSIQTAECYGYNRHRYDALLESYETGITVEDLDPLFKNLKNSTAPFVNEAKDFPNPFKKEINEQRQENFVKKIPAKLGLSDKLCRLDKSAHPFSTTLGAKDFRITVRYDLNDPISAIMAVLHESGHAQYEMGLSNASSSPSPLHTAASFGIHESQSRLWENQIGRSRQFWEFYYPVLLKEFEISHYDLSFDDLYNYVNTVARTKTRVEADQLTYNLHIILRYEIEKELVSEQLKVKEIPERWNSQMEELFDIKIQNDAEGVLQDVHWSGGSFGYFPTYSLGNIYSAQLFHKFLESNPGFWQKVSTSGDFSLLSSWLYKNVHSKGRLYDPPTLIEKVTGELPSVEYLSKYLKAKVKEFF